MPTTVITFLGHQLSSRDGTATYLKLPYTFPDGTVTQPSRSFVTELVRSLNAEGKQVDRLVIAGTATSMWCTLVDLVANNDDEALFTLLGEIEDGSIRKDGKVVDDALLAKFGAALSKHLDGIELHLIIIGFCESEGEQLEVVSHLARVVPVESQLVLDITHSFRHLPMLGLVAANYLRHAKLCELAEVYYAMADARHSLGYTPVVKVGGLLRMLEVSEAFATFHHTANLLPLASTLKVPGLDEAAFYVETARLGDAKKHANSALAAITLSSPPLLQLAETELRNVLAGVASNDKLHDRQLEVARHHIHRGTYTLGTILLFESLLTRLVFNSKGSRRGGENDHDHRKRVAEEWALQLPRKDKDHFHQLRKLRNALAHGSPPGEAQVQRALADRDALTSFLIEKLTWVEAIKLQEPRSGRPSQPTRRG